MKNTTTKNQVIDYLQWTTDEYEERLFLTIWNWCKLYGGYPSRVQQLMANSQINRWFMKEYHLNEIQFLKIVDALPHSSVTQREAYYKACTAEIMALYPKPIIDEIKKNKDFSNQFLTNTLIYYAN